MRARWLLKGLVWLLLSAPLLWLGWRITLELQATGSGLGADPGEAVVHYLGEWALIVLLCSFSVTPLRRLLDYSAFGQVRRLVGLFAYFYVLLHALAYLAFYLGFSLAELATELTERTYITAGMAALILLTLLAGTSTRGWQRRLGVNWRRLHRLIFPALALALVHLWWLTRDGYAQVLLFSLWFAMLCAQRWWARPQRNRRAAPPGVTSDDAPPLRH